MSEYKMRIAICDDEPHALQTIADMTKEVTAQENIPCELVSYQSGSALLEAINEGEEYSLLLLEAAMAEMSGIALAAALRAQNNHVAIVFMSSHLEMALSGYEVSAVRYLAKPLNAEKLREALLYCWRTGLNRQELALPTAHGMRKVRLEEMMYAETWGRGVKLVLTEGQEQVIMKISELETLLPSCRFVLCHRTVIVNLDYVRYIRYCELELKTGVTLPVSKYRQNAIREKWLHLCEADLA